MQGAGVRSLVGVWPWKEIFLISSLFNGLCLLKYVLKKCLFIVGPLLLHVDFLESPCEGCLLCWLLLLPSAGCRMWGLQWLRSTGSVALAHGPSCLVRGGAFWIRDRTSVRCIARWILNYWTTRKPQMSLVLISFMYFVPNVARSSENLI